MTFKVGDMVVLKSDSPVMTVTAVDKKPALVHTVWFTDRGVERRAHFPPSALEEHLPVSPETLPARFKGTPKVKREGK
jgi:uncharacterized protein YodC (DUF2158 family)